MERGRAQSNQRIRAVVGGEAVQRSRITPCVSKGDRVMGVAVPLAQEPAGRSEGGYEGRLPAAIRETR